MLLLFEAVIIVQISPGFAIPEYILPTAKKRFFSAVGTILHTFSINGPLELHFTIAV